MINVASPTLRREIGQGGFSVVYLIEDLPAVTNSWLSSVSR
jgi:hypothetical protein